MNNWTVKVKVSEEDMDTGKIRNRTETYLVEAETIEASQKMIKELYRGSVQDHEIRSVSKSNITEFVNEETLKSLTPIR